MATVMAEVALDDTLKDFDDDKEFVNAVGECRDLFSFHLLILMKTCLVTRRTRRIWIRLRKYRRGG